MKIRSKSNSIKPPDLFVDKQDSSQYERKLRRWSHVCGVDPKHQGDHSKALSELSTGFFGMFQNRKGIQNEILGNVEHIQFVVAIYTQELCYSLATTSDESSLNKNFGWDASM